MRGAACVLSVLMVSAAATAGVLTGQAQSLIVGYMNEDGELVPVARFDGKLLFEVSAKRVRKLTSADVSGC